MLIGELQGLWTNGFVFYSCYLNHFPPLPTVPNLEWNDRDGDECLIICRQLFDTKLVYVSTTWSRQHIETCLNDRKWSIHKHLTLCFFTFLPCPHITHTLFFCLSSPPSPLSSSAEEEEEEEEPMWEAQPPSARTRLRCVTGERLGCPGVYI